MISPYFKNYQRNTSLGPGAYPSYQSRGSLYPAAFLHTHWPQPSNKSYFSAFPANPNQGYDIIRASRDTGHQPAYSSYYGSYQPHAHYASGQTIVSSMPYGYGQTIRQQHGYGSFMPFTGQYYSGEVYPQTGSQSQLSRYGIENKQAQAGNGIQSKKSWSSPGIQTSDAGTYRSMIETSDGVSGQVRGARLSYKVL